MAQDASKGRLGVISRRGFFGAIGLCFWRRPIVLEAIAAERMPQTLVVSGVEKAPFFEVRDYGSAEVTQVLERCGVRAVMEDRGRLLFAFESLEERERVWREVGTSPDWIGLAPREIAVYRARPVLGLTLLGVICSTGVEL
jgi:hypothetical protein